VFIDYNGTIFHVVNKTTSCYYVGLSPPLGGFAFEKLFSPFTVSTTDLRSKEMVRSSSASSYIPDNPDKQDLCDIFDNVHRKSVVLTVNGLNSFSKANPPNGGDSPT
jgi:hypothetical protein